MAPSFLGDLAPAPQPDQTYRVHLQLGRRGLIVLTMKAPTSTEAAIRAFEKARETHAVGLLLRVLTVELVD
jgi:hypothetical protein